MTIPIETARRLVNSLSTGRFRNLSAQTHAKHVLREVREAPENFPDFDEKLDEKITLNAYALLAAGCSLLEQSDPEGASAIERAATWLHEVHSHELPDDITSHFHQLVAAMAFYAAGHYSRAFVCLRRVEQGSVAAALIASFVRKHPDELARRIAPVLLETPATFGDRGEHDDWVVTLSIARALSWTWEYLIGGDDDMLERAVVTLADAQIVAETSSSPGMWWVVRLLRLMLGDLGNSSLWRTLPPHFDGGRAPIDRYVKHLAFSSPPVVELWESQKTALTLALDQTSRGAVVNLRTSAGKTRVAELAILQTLMSDADATVMYLAPFRSLAFELERSLGAIFEPLGFHVSHLYGGQRISAVDMQMASDSRITIATPEKARALMRAAPDIGAKIRLFIIDEGHLIGRSVRDVRNEIFVDSLRQDALRLNARIVLLSAVLPNTEELAEWVTGNSSAVARSTWKPSVERYGLMRWNGQRVALEWLGEVPSFNPSFVVSAPKSTRANSAMFPAQLNEAVAASAVRLSEIGPVMIFSARATMVPGFAKAALYALGAQAPAHPWPEREWKVFEEACGEELEVGAIELEAARSGVICHSNRLTPLVRMATEQLMRAHPPRIIVATLTLGQGVNVGISSVIVANTAINKDHHVDKRDFWNICGRAGRAFVDGEGKVLVALNASPGRAWQSSQDEHRAKAYFDQGPTDRVESGVLIVLNALWKVARESNVSFDVLVDRIANDDRGSWGNRTEEIESWLDLLDDTLLSMHLASSPATAPASDDLSWIEHVLRGSLAAIQARAGVDSIGDTGVLRLFAARTNTILRRVPNALDRRSFVASGLPISIAQRLRLDMPVIRAVVQTFVEAGWHAESLNAFVAQIEAWARDNARSILEVLPEAGVLAAIRPRWLAGESLKTIANGDDAILAVCRELYGYGLPWLLNAVAQQFDPLFEEDVRTLVSDVALVVELGVPNVLAARIFLAGIKSRTVSTELEQMPITLSDSMPVLSRQLRDGRLWQSYDAFTSPAAKRWLALLAGEQRTARSAPAAFSNFVLTNSPITSPLLYVRTYEERLWLCTPDGAVKMEVADSSEMPFSAVADDPAFAMVREGDAYRLDIRDPKFRSSN